MRTLTAWRLLRRVRCRICGRWLGWHNIAVHERRTFARAADLEHTQQLARFMLAKPDLDPGDRTLLEDITRYPWHQRFPSAPDQQDS